MPRIVSTTWFKDIGFINQPILDFKLARLSIRQTVHLFVWAALAWLFYRYVAGLFFGSFILKGCISLAIFAACMIIFGRRGKVFAPEWYLYYFIRKYITNLRSKRKGKSRKSVALPEKPKVRSSHMMGLMGEPTRIVGVLYNPSTGERLSRVEYETRIDGKPYYSSASDENGEYSFIYTPSSEGARHVEIIPEGFNEPVDKVKVECRKFSESPTTEEGTEKRTIGRETLKIEEESKPSLKEGEEEIEKYVYELTPTNFIDLSPEEQNNLTDAFRGFLNSLDCKIKMIALRSSKEVNIGEQTVEPEFFRFYIVSEKPIDRNLAGGRFLYQRTTELPEPKVVRTFRNFVAVEGGRNEKTGSVYEMGEQLIEGFPAELYSAADRVTISIEPQDQGDAVKHMERFMHMKGAISRGGGDGFRVTGDISMFTVTYTGDGFRVTGRGTE